MMKLSKTISIFLLLISLIGFCLPNSLFADSPDKGVGATDYPLTTCIISGDKLGVMEPPVVIHHDGEEVRFCCQECVGEFKKDPPKYLQVLHQLKAGSAPKGGATSSSTFSEGTPKITTTITPSGQLPKQGEQTLQKKSDAPTSFGEKK